MEQGAESAVEFGIHENDVLAVGECAESEVGAVLDRPGDFDDDVDPVALGGGAEVVSDRELIVVNAGRELGGGGDFADGSAFGLFEGEAGVVESPIDDADNLHALGVAIDLQDDAAAHEACADKGDEDGLSGLCALFERMVDHNHGG